MVATFTSGHGSHRVDTYSMKRPCNGDRFQSCSGLLSRGLFHWQTSHHCQKDLTSALNEGQWYMRAISLA
uniref:Uncharacterized protein n=1 Tax=Romanomermis culicivorax TaxID=13658 RepID=A0A915IDW1_ROMCU